MFTNKVNRKIAIREHLWFIAAAVVLIFSGIGLAQTTTDTPEQTFGGYRVSANTEMGWRWQSLEGNENKYRSDLNYKDGFRFFDSNIFMEKENGKWFDSLLIMNSGWGADPNGYFRLSMEKLGFYKLNANTRKVNYFNNLSNHVAVNGASQHTQDWKQNITDIDFSLFPQNRRLRLNVGGSFSDTNGTGLWTGRGYRDDFPVPNDTKITAKDFRIGAEGELAGFDWGLNYGRRTFSDRSNFLLAGQHPGNNTADTTVYNSYSKYWPTDGTSNFGQFNVNRTFAQKFDFTGRIVYSSTESMAQTTESFTGRDNNNNFIDSDQFNFLSSASRPQLRGDVGITYRITDGFRISNTTSYDRFTVNGGMDLKEYLLFRNAANTTNTNQVVTSFGYRVNDYDRLTNLIEADFQLNNVFAFHAGWRYAKREINVYGREGSVTQRFIVPVPNPVPTPSVSSAVIGEEEENSTNAFLAGVKIKPTKGWYIYADFEKGSADNVFSRLENYDYTNFRIRSRWTYKTVVVNVSALTKDNTNPSMTYGTPPLPFGTDMTSRTYTGDVAWNPNDSFYISGGYTYRNQDAKTPIIVNLGTNQQGLSEFYVRDRYFYVEGSAKLHKRFSIYGTYRMNKDNGQGDIATPPVNSPNIVASYPMQMDSPEVRLAIRLSRNIDWNIGYQYYNYDDVQTPTQNYKAHLPYTSVRFYFGGRAGDR